MNPQGDRALNLRVGDLVEVRSEAEILATLDERGALDGLPFMPEMLEFCGKRYRVEKRAVKTCDTVTFSGLRRLYNTIHLAGLRCSGAAHDGCQAYCSFYWNEAWLKRIHRGDDNPRSTARGAAATASPTSPRCDRARLHELTRRHDPSQPSEVLYRCQATDLLQFTHPMGRRDIGQYFRDVLSGNIGIMDLVKGALFRLFQKSLEIGVAHRAQIWTYNAFQSCIHGTPYPFAQGTLDKTPRQRLDIQPGEFVQIKSYDEILATLSKKNKNQGLSFDPEMVPYCGSVRRVIARVERIIDDRTCKMIRIASDCLMLEGTVCQSRYGNNRLFCPRMASAYWREIWVKRVGDSKQSVALDTAVAESAPSDDVQLPNQA